MTNPDHPRLRFHRKLEQLRQAAILPTESSFAGEAKVPGDMTMAFAADRPELLVLAKTRDLHADQVKVLYDLIFVLAKTNQALRAHIRGVGQLISLIDELITNHSVADLATLPEMVANLLDFCRFQDEIANEVAEARNVAPEHL